MEEKDFWSCSKKVLERERGLADELGLEPRVLMEPKQPMVSAEIFEDAGQGETDCESKMVMKDPDQPTKAEVEEHDVDRLLSLSGAQTLHRGRATGTRIPCTSGSTGDLLLGSTTFT